MRTRAQCRISSVAYLWGKQLGVWFFCGFVGVVCGFSCGFLSFFVKMKFKLGNILKKYILLRNELWSSV